MTDEEKPTTLDDIWMVLLDILDELRESNNKARIGPDRFCRNCGEALEEESHEHDMKPTRLS